MHSLISRLNSVFAFGLTMLCLLALMCFTSSLLFDSKPKVNIGVTNIKIGNITEYGVSDRKVDLALVNFNLGVDVSPLVDWNTKELFLYLVAEYSTEVNRINQVVLWDKIIEVDKHPLTVKVKNKGTKYHFFDDGSGLAGHSNITISLHWNTIPLTGILFRNSHGHQRIEFPSHYMRLN
eukprot:Nk52_evm13s2640 gene=Nk52_evmTU13s2640